MATIVLSTTVDIGSQLTASAEVLGYLWCKRLEIQTWLDKESVIFIGDPNDSEYNFDEADAMRMENANVEEIVDYLSAVYEITTEDDLPVLVKDAAKMTAASIGLARQASSQGMEVAGWTIRLDSQAWSSLKRKFVNQSLDLVKKDVPLHDRLIMSKLRERQVTVNV
jgi:hypothetical protein